MAKKLGIPVLGLLAVAATSLLSGCNQPPDKLITCPSIRIPQNTERVTRFAEGAGRDITDVILQAEVKFLSGECSVDEEEISMTFPVAVRGSRGPAEKDGVEPVTVFIAVTTRDREILQRREIPMSLVFEGNRTSIVSSDYLTVEIPKKPDQKSSDFLVFLGLKLTEAELTYNRTEARR